MRTLILMMLTLSVFSSEVRPVKSYHEVYRLLVGEVHGIPLKKEVIQKKEVRLFDKPSLEKGKVVVKYRYSKIMKEHSSWFLSKFNEKNKTYWFLGISSKEKKGKFYKVLHKGQSLWVPGEDVTAVQPVEDIVVGLAQIYISNKFIPYKIPGKEALEDESRKLIKQLGNVFPAQVVGSKWIKNELWFNIEVFENKCEGTKILKNPLHIWMKAYSKKGEPEYTYAFKGGC